MSGLQKFFVGMLLFLFMTMVNGGPIMMPVAAQSTQADSNIEVANNTSKLNSENSDIEVANSTLPECDNSDLLVGLTGA